MSEQDAAASLQALLDGPAVAAPLGAIQNLDNPPNERTVTHAVPSTSLVLATLSVAMCMYSRVIITRKFELPDCERFFKTGLVNYSILLGFGTFVGFAVMCLLAGAIAPGVHMWNVRLGDLGQFLYYLRIGSILYAPTIFLIKLSILWQYIQVFMPNKQPRSLYWLTISLIGANLLAYLILMCLQIWSCRPMRRSWDPLVTEGSCLNTNALNIWASSVNVISDTAIFLLPQSIIWRLQMPLRQKLIVSGLFFLAVLAIAAASIRLYYTVKLSENTNDVTWFAWMTGIWALVEMVLGVIVACMPSAGIFFRHFSQSKWLTSMKGLTTWRRIHGQENSTAYAMKDLTATDNSYAHVQKKSWTRSYGVSGLETRATMEDSESAQNLKMHSMNHS